MIKGIIDLIRNMPEYLRLWLSFNRRRQSKKIEIKGQQIIEKQMRIPANQILRYVKDYLYEGGESVSSFITIWIDIKGIRQNLFRLKKKKTELRLNLNDHGYFELNVIIVEGSEKNNIIKNFQLNYDSYQRLKNNMERVMIETKEEEQKGDEQRPIDIAYFFADPLVRIKKSQNKLTITSQNEVSYQVQYDQFIDMVGKEELRLNFRIEMMVATETNIKNTLLEGASLLHFACHGSQVGTLKIEHQKQIGELADLSPDRLMDLLQNKTLPKAIIFNVCHSYELARRISLQKKIMTIGYKGEANDRYCQKFTKEFYMGIFRDGRPIREVFNQIKERITEQNSEEGNKLHIFPQQKNALEVIRISESKPSRKEFVIRWNMLESLRGNDTLGVKKQMYKLIKKLTNDERMSYIFLEGDKNTGKTSLMNKIRIYVLNRKVFTDQFYFNLKKPNGEPMETMLELRLTFQTSFLAWRTLMKKKAIEGRVASLIIIDGAQNIVRYQYAELTKYVQNEMKDKLTYGKIVIITRKDEPLSKREAECYGRAVKHIKEPSNIESKQFNIFVSRYWESYKQQITKLRLQKMPLNDIVKGLKLSETPARLEEKVLQLGKPPAPTEPKYIEQQQAVKQLQQLRRQTERLLRDIDIEIAQNHHIYVSTIFQEIADRQHIKLSASSRPQTKEEIRDKKKEDISHLVNGFKALFQRILLHQQALAIQSFKNIARESLKIAGLCYLYDCCFEKHIMNCQKMNIMANVLLLSSFISSPFKVGRRESQAEEEIVYSHIEGIQLEQLLKQYKLKILLTLYTYYTECHYRLFEVGETSEQTRHALEERSKKVEIVWDQLYFTIQKRSKENQIQIKENFLKKYRLLNSIIQELQYSQETNHPKLLQKRKNSDILILASLDNTEITALTSIIHVYHKKIEQYWRLYEQIKEGNSHFEILSKDSLVIMLLSIIKLINYNQLYLQNLQSKGQNYIKRDMQAYVELYVKIMQTIEQSEIFTHDNRSHSDYIVWRFPNSKSIKGLFRRYFRMFIDVYFHVEKLYQNLTKRYEIKIFNQLLQLSDSHSKVKLQSIKKQIETHKDQQFLSNYSCETYISLPLLKFKSIDDNVGNRVNLKRFESHVYRFQEQFFSTLDRQIKNDIFSLDKEFFMTEQESKSLIQLIILNCSDTAVECQSITGKGEVLRIRHITRVPKSPVIILFGCNVKSLIGTFRELNSCSVLITIDLGEQEHPNQKNFIQKNMAKQNWNVREARIQKLQDYSSRLQISYSVLEFFYTSFCKHFFSVDHVLFLQQVKSSYHLAKAEALMKTKIRMQTGPNFQYSSFIKESIDGIDISISQQTLQQIRSKSAYHFMFKQYKLQNFAKCFANLTKNDSEKNSIQGEIGCNREICEMLEIIDRAKKSENHIIFYKSKEMQEQYTSTLLSKLKKHKEYEIIVAELVIPENLEISRTSSTWNFKTDQENQDINSIQTKKIMIFSDLRESEFQEEVSSIPDREPTTIRLFFTNARYKGLTADCYEQCIMEDYGHQRIEFELYLIECKSQKPAALGKSCMTAFKKLSDQHSFSLAQIKREIQNRHH